MRLGAFLGAVKNLLYGKSAIRRDQSDDGNSLRLKGRVWTAVKYFAVFATLMGIGGFLLTASGIVPIKASSGHWEVTRWFLQFSKQRSVATHTIGTDVPRLDDARLILKGAGAFETNCLACHGSPAAPASRVVQQMTPRPPYLPSTLHRWNDAELFYIVKHGIKFTGMPAWPAQQRDDEVWAVVAFIRLLPGIDAAEYRRLVHGDDGDPAANAEPLSRLMVPTEMPRTIESCALCHGADGLGRGTGAFPKLAGQSSEYLYQSLVAYARNDRNSGLMGPIAAGLSDQEMRELARYYADLEAPRQIDPAAEDAAAVERGRMIALDGIREHRIQSCASCHGPSALARNPVHPDLAGQYPDYLSLQLQLFKKDIRGGEGYAEIMHQVTGRKSDQQVRSMVMRQVAIRLSAQQVRDVSSYYSSLPPVPRD